jgi:ElaB/YqjD/DUF883 family membrane-anchored ribosome-binding protein
VAFNKGINEMAQTATRRKNESSDLSEFVDRVSEHGQELSEGVQEVASNFRGAVDRSVNKQPMATLLIAGLAGFVLGAIWKS